MVKKNKILVLFTTIIIISIISIISVIKVYSDHINKLYQVVENKIEENAKQCFFEGLCDGDEITLENLISKGYIENQINPVTKEYVSLDLKISFDGKNCHTSIR